MKNNSIHEEQISLPDVEGPEERQPTCFNSKWKISNYRPYGIIARDPDESTYKVGDDKFPAIVTTHGEYTRQLAEQIVADHNAALNTQDTKSAEGSNKPEDAEASSFPSSCKLGEPLMHGQQPYRWCETHDRLMLTCEREADSSEVRQLLERTEQWLDEYNTGRRVKDSKTADLIRELNTEVRQQQEQNYVAWCRYVDDGNRIVLCDSDANGAFKVYRSSLQQQEWMLIESAPKDGTHILLAREQPWSSSANVCVAFWADEHQTDFPHWQTETGLMVDDKVYRLWQPLPPPPIKGEK